MLIVHVCRIVGRGLLMQASNQPMREKTDMTASQINPEFGNDLNEKRLQNVRALAFHAFFALLQNLV